MLFNSVQFLLIFLPAAMLAIYLASRFSVEAFLVTLSLASVIFYGAHVPGYVVLLLGSAALNYAVAGLIEDGRNPALYKLALGLNVAVLAVFKYAAFVAMNLNQLMQAQIQLPQIALPLAISFLTFEQIAFLTDVHRKRYGRGNVLEYLSFITFFPKLIAGPIIRYGEYWPQLALRRRMSLDLVMVGLTIFCFGLIKKVLLADYFGQVSDKGYGQIAATQSIDVHDAWAAFFAYPLQIYFDFSAYSEMAIGIAWMMGFRLPLNFDSPYKATSIIDFWRRWHITLSAVLRDYIYIPLGGNRGGPIRRYVNLMLVMLIGGLWHGAAWTFVIWGGIHGGYLIVNHLYRSRWPRAWRFPAPIAVNLSWAATLVAVAVAWVFFRSQDLDGVSLMFTAMRQLTLSDIARAGEVAIWIAAGWGICLFMPNLAEMFSFKLDRERVDWATIEALPDVTPKAVALAALFLVASMLIMLRGTPSAFIYFQF